IMRGHAIANGVYVAATNRVGVENGIRLYGSSFICDPSGKVLAQAGRKSTEMIVAEISPDVINHWREHFPLLHQRRHGLYGRIGEAYANAERPTWLKE
ncbi:MAG: hydrolase, partial [Anaerolineae bacterium]|nr:hydrolase [Anaerolineae bacterium]